MRLGIRSAGLAFLAVVFAAAPARSQEEVEFAGPTPWSYTLVAGAMLPAGQEGAGLERGFQMGGSLGYAINPAFIVGADFSYVSSTDDLRTSIAALGIRGRLSPSPDFTRIYLLGGLAAHGIFYNPKNAQFDPASVLRLGGSFGFGLDLVTAQPLTLGLEGAYHGIIYAYGDALSYVTIGIYASLRPGEP